MCVSRRGPRGEQTQLLLRTFFFFFNQQYRSSTVFMYITVTPVCVKYTRDIVILRRTGLPRLSMVVTTIPRVREFVRRSTSTSRGLDHPETRAVVSTTPGLGCPLHPGYNVHYIHYVPAITVFIFNLAVTGLNQK